MEQNENYTAKNQTPQPMEVKKTEQQAFVESKKIDVVEQRIMMLVQERKIAPPEGYNAALALNAAKIILSATETRDKKPVLSACSQQSIATALLTMVIEGTNPLQGQCYFVPYGETVQYIRGYLGDIAIAKRLGLQSIEAHCIYEGDEVKITHNEDGTIKITVNQSFENIDVKKIIGAYAVAKYQNGYTHTEIMTIQQIRQAWMQSALYGKGAQHEFPDEMAKKTVISRALKHVINSSTDVQIPVYDGQ